MTFSVIGQDPESREIGVVTATGSIAVGAQVPHCRFGAGAIVTQGHTTNILFARNGLPLLAKGLSASEVANTLVEQDQGRDFRQLAVMDCRGQTSCWTGPENEGSKGHEEGPDLVVAGNFLAGPDVLTAMRQAYEAKAGTPLAERLLAALQAGEVAGGDKRGTCSAALLIDGGKGAALNLRVDYHETPVAALRELHERSKDRDYRDFLMRLPDEHDPHRH